MNIKTQKAKKFFLRMYILLFLLANMSFTYANQPLISIQKWQTHNGIEVYFVPSNSLPMVDITVAFKAGSSRDGIHSGLAALTNNFLGQGTMQMDADQIADAFDSVGAQFTTQVDRDMASVSLRSLTDSTQLKSALSIFNTVLTTADFSTPALQRVQQQTISAINTQSQSPAIIADQTLMKQIYGAHPYARPVLGTAQTVAGLTADNLREFYQTYYVAKNAVVVIVGDLTQKQAKNVAEQITKNLPIGIEAAPLPHAILNQKYTVKIDYPSAQTHVRIGELGINWHDPDLFPLYVGNYTLGGGVLVSRLFNIVREQQGLSYNIYSAFQPLSANGPFFVGLQTQTAQADQSIALTNKIIAKYIKEGPTAQELTAAKKNMIGSLPLRLDSNQAIANAVLMIAFNQLPLDFFDKFIDKVQAVNTQQIRTAFQKHLQLGNLVVVTVGKS